MKKAAILTLAACLVFSGILQAQSSQAAKLSPERAGKIGVPLGKIAFVRDGDLWVMDWDGKSQFKVVTAQNADGKVSWAPDGKRIVFTRKGLVDLKGPDNLGGQHKVYDIFIAYLDSAYAKNTNWWFRITGDMGGRYPEWSKDGNKIIFTNDLNANKVNSIMPNYQTCIIDTAGRSKEMPREDYNKTELNVLMPTIGLDSMNAFVIYKGFNPMGVGIASLNRKTLSEKDIGEEVKLLPKATAPAWSPDGKWIAFVDAELSKQGIYIVSPDLSERFLIYKPTVGRNLQTYPLSWSPDSKWITFATVDGSLWIIDITGNQLKQLTGPGLNLAPAWSKNK